MGIGSKAKKDILEDLSRLSINESTIFPGIEYQAKIVKDLYAYSI